MYSVIVADDGVSVERSGDLESIIVWWGGQKRKIEIKTVILESLTSGLSAQKIVCSNDLSKDQYELKKQT